jgi:hypothetical protein
MSRCATFLFAIVTKKLYDCAMIFNAALLLKRLVFIAKSIVVLALIISLSNISALASTSKRTLSVTGTLEFVSKNVGPDGQCTLSAWVDHCASGNCVCVQVIDTSATGNLFGAAPLTASNFFITIDPGVDPVTAPAVGGGPEPQVCGLEIGVMTISSTKGRQITFNALGTVCDHIIGSTNTNPKGTGDKLVLSGIGGVSDTPPSNPASSGFGTFTAQVKETSSKTFEASLTLKGLLSH